MDPEVRCTATLTLPRYFGGYLGTMQILAIQYLHSATYQKEPGFLGCIQFDHDIAVLSIQIWQKN